MTGKMSVQQAEAILKITLIQRQMLLQQLKEIETNDKLTSDEKLNLMADLLGQFGRKPNEDARQ